MRMPGADRAVVDVRKLRDYCLNPLHPRGRHKARVFAALLGLGPDDHERLEDALRAALRREEAAPMGSDHHGERYVLDFVMTGKGGEVPVRSRWIVRRGEGFPRLTTCHVIRRRRPA